MHPSRRKTRSLLRASRERLQSRNIHRLKRFLSAGYLCESLGEQLEHGQSFSGVGHPNSALRLSERLVLRFSLHSCTQVYLINPTNETTGHTTGYNPPLTPLVSTLCIESYPLCY